ncbi:MAG: right-handed parallel beta-helix repeat-containing protein, partial [Candidatus Hydrogenedentes bacterium]|nr:right-handed parallel beta-helix repeat-containing protein [Candidatus Hydrogenedentota bacterium]
MKMTQEIRGECLLAHVAVCSLALLVANLLIGCHEAAPPTARFQAQPVQGPAPLSVQFTDESSPGSRGIAQRRWDFGDTITSFEVNPLHTYSDPGLYTVSLFVGGDGGQDTWVFKDMIRVTSSPGIASPSQPDDSDNKEAPIEIPAKTDNPIGTRTYYVSPGGSDTNDGSVDHPWVTLQRAAESLGAGDVLNIATGVYEGDVDFTNSGTAEAPISVKGESRESTIVNGHVQLSQGVSYFDLASMTVQGFRIWGVTLLGNNHHVHLHDLKVIGGEVGFRFTDGNSGDPPAEGPVSDVLLEDSEVDGPTGPAVDCTPGPCDRMVFRNLDLHGAGIQGESSFGADGIGLERGKDVLVEDCYVHDNGGDAIDLNSRDYGGNAEGIVVRCNRVVRNHLMGIKLWAGGRMENNVVWGQGLTPVVVGKYPGTYEVVNNTIAFNMYADFSERDYALVAGYPNDDTGIPP